MERLDWVVANEKWVNESDSMRVETLSTYSSYHHALLLGTKEPGNIFQRKKIFRFKTKWALDKEGEQPICKAWLERGTSPNC